MKKISCLILSLVSVLLHAQEQPKNVMQWGFSLGIETQTLGIESLQVREPDQTWAASDRNKPGATFGIVAQKKIWHGLSFQSGLSLSYTHNRVDFHPDGPKSFQFTDLEAPLYFTAVNPKKGPMPLRAKILFGPRIGWNLSNNQDDRLRFYRERVAFDLGLGVEIMMGKWKLCPEAIYSHGLNNIHNFTGTEFDFLTGRVVRDKVAFRMVLLRAK